MAIFTFVLGILFVAAGFGALIASMDLLPTELGLLYAGCGALAVCAGGVTLAIAALIYRLGALATMIARAQGREAWPAPAAAPAEASEEHEAGASPVEEAAAPVASDEAAPLEPEPLVEDAPPLPEEDSINDNRTGHLPTMAEIEHALAEPEPAPTLVGRYSAGGANYMIFSDGSIEAETAGGAFKFASMSDFKAYLAGGQG